MAAFLVLKV